MTREEAEQELRRCEAEYNNIFAATSRLYTEIYDLKIKYEALNAKYYDMVQEEHKAHQLRQEAWERLRGILA